MRPPPKGPAVITTLLVSAGCWHGGGPAPEPPPKSCDQAGDCVDLVFHGVAITPNGPLAHAELTITTAAPRQEDNEPLPSVTTDGSGRFAIRIDKAVRAIAISAVGYERVISPVNWRTHHYEIRLRPIAPPQPMPQPVT